MSLQVQRTVVIVVNLIQQNVVVSFDFIILPRETGEGKNDKRILIN
jgi:hypothetical protein